MNVRLRFLADEDFDNDIVRGLLRHLPTLDIVRAQDVGLSGQLDVCFTNTLPVLVASRHSRASGNPGDDVIGTGCPPTRA